MRLRLCPQNMPFVSQAGRLQWFSRIEPWNVFAHASDYLRRFSRSIVDVTGASDERYRYKVAIGCPASFLGR
jgi:hypothetical protein